MENVSGTELESLLPDNSKFTNLVSVIVSMESEYEVPKRWAGPEVEPQIEMRCEYLILRMTCESPAGTKLSPSSE